MQARSFAEVLDASVAATIRPGAPRGGKSFAFRTAPMDGSQFPWWPGLGVFGRFESARSGPGVEKLQGSPPRRTSRMLTATERSALQALRRAGAGELDGDFTIPELKRSFRRLARRLHPDAHPGADPAVARQLANAFASARDAYGVLRAAAPANA